MVRRNEVYGGTLYWYSGHFPPRSWYTEEEWHRLGEPEFRVLYVGSTSQWDIEDRDRQHRSKNSLWTRIDWEVPVTTDVPPDIRLVVAEEALRLVLKPVLNTRRACHRYTRTEWSQALDFVVNNTYDWVPADWKARVCRGEAISTQHGYWGCEGACRRPESCPL